MEFENEIHQRTGCSLLKASEELIETLEDNQVCLQNLITSKYIAHFLEEVSVWQNKLMIADQVITVWFEVQRTWTHLESIFMSSEDIRKQLPTDSERFDRIDAEFRVLMKEMSVTSNVVQSTNREGLCARLENLQKELTLCEKALADYVTSWIETRKIPAEKSNLVILFDKYIPQCLETIRTRFKKITPIAEMAHIEMLCHLLNCFLIPANTPAECPKEWHELYFVFACIWAFGSAMFQDQAIDYRIEFSGTVFDYYLDSETKQFTPWTEKLPKFN
uniref:Uncharacterized protein n=1 Tax=Megaselia scalaris TaxID=36166 RepID=T1H0E2_MEGSC